MKVKKILFAALGAIVCLGIVSAALFAFFTVNRKVSLDEPAKGVMDLGTYGIDFDDKSGLFPFPRMMCCIFKTRTVSIS